MTRFYLNYALRSLLRGGQRSLLALICVAFAVLSLVSMLLLSDMVRGAMVVPQRAQMGGDFELSRGATLTQADIEQLEQLRRSGAIRDYTLNAPNVQLTMVRRSNDGRVHFLSRAFGVETRSFPLVGRVRMLEPADRSIAELLRASGDVLVTRDVASRMALKLGDVVELGGVAGTNGVPLRIVGIAASLPNRRADSIIYDLATAQLIAGRPDVAYSAAVSADRAPVLAGWNVARATDIKLDRAGRVFDFMLKGAGILGLLVGGVGIANTLTVSLARRTNEIAILKSIGYRQRDLLALLGIETAVLGIAGSLVGALLAIGVAAQLMGLLDATEGALALEFVVAPVLLIGGVAAGIITTLVFGTFATLRASAVRPGMLLRQIAPAATRRSRLNGASAILVASVVFAVLSSAIMGSVGRGLTVIAAGIAALALLGLGFGFLLFLILKLPVPGPLLNLARRNLQHQGGRAIVAVVALFVGAFTIGFAAASLLSARERVAQQRGSDAGLNLRIHAPRNQENNVAELLRGHGVAALTTHSLSVKGRGLNQLEGRSGQQRDWNLEFVSGRWSDAPDAVHITELATRPPFSMKLGDTVTVAASTGSALLRVAGVYRNREPEWSFDGLKMLVNRETVDRLGSDSATLAIVAAVPVSQLDALAAQLGKQFPRSIVLNKGDFNDLMVRSYSSIFTFVAAIASLALLAGAVLIANAVGLSLIERKRDLGILKAIGYSARNVLTTILLENAILGALAGAAGVAAVRMVAAWSNQRIPDAGITLSPGSAALLFAVSVTLALSAATLVAWGPTRVRPLTILRED